MSRSRRCRRRESFEGQEPHREEARFATGRNTVNPRIGSRAQQTCAVGEEQTVEVVRNHGDGSRERLAVVPRREPRRRGSRASDSSARRRWRGDLWTNPREAVRPAGRTAWIGTRRESRRQGQEGRAHTLSRVAHPGRRDLEGPDAHRKDRASKVEEGSGGARHRGIDRGQLPPWMAPDGWSERRGPFVARKRSPVGVCVVLPHALAPRRGELDVPEGMNDPEDQTNHIPARLGGFGALLRRRSEKTRLTDPRVHL
jgi:hypothetical protein